MILTKGRLYRIRLTSGEWTTAEYLGERVISGYTNRVRTRYCFKNMRTGREIVLRSKQKIRECETVNP